MTSQSSPEEEGLDLRIYARVIIRGWWLLLIGLLIGASAAFVLTRGGVPVYEATAIILVQGGRTPGSVTSGDLQTAQRLALNLVDLVTTRPILEQAAAEYESAGFGRVTGRVEVRSTRSLMSVTATDSDPQAAANLANVTSQVFIDDFLRRQLTEIAQFQVALQQFQIPSDSALIAVQVASVTTLSLLEEALPPDEPNAGRRIFLLAFAALAGLMVGVSILFIKEYLDDRIRSPEDLALLSDIPTLGTINHLYRIKSDDNMIMRQRSDPLLIERFNFIRTNLGFALADDEHSTLLVTSSRPKEGKSTTASHLGLTIASGGKSVLLVDLDLRRPMLHQVFGLDNQVGLGQLFARTATFEEVAHPTAVPSLRVIPAGAIPPDPPQMLRSRRFTELMEELKSEADIVILDSPPILAVTDPLLLAQTADGIIIVIDSRKTKRAFVRQAIKMLQPTNTNIVGAILNRVDSSRDKYYSYYDYGHTGTRSQGLLARGRAAINGFTRRLFRRHAR